MPSLTRLAVPALALLLGACATRVEQGRERVVAAGEIGAAYSEVETRARLAVTPDSRCDDDECIAVQAFRTDVARIAERVADGAYALAFEQAIVPPSFYVEVPGKDDIGTLSTASGRIIVFDGLRKLRLAEPVLAFLIAREMGHVLAKHHEENSALSIGVSVAVTLLFPMVNVLRGAEAAYAAATTTASLLSSAVSFAGSRIVRGLYREEQQREADVYALNIIVSAGWTPFEVASGLHALAPLLVDAGWMAELRVTLAWLDQIAVGPPFNPVTPETEAVLPPEVLAPAAFIAALPPEADLHEREWGVVWRQGEWRAAPLCVPPQHLAVTPQASVVPQEAALPQGAGAAVPQAGKKKTKLRSASKSKRSGKKRGATR